MHSSWVETTQWLRCASSKGLHTVLPTWEDRPAAKQGHTWSSCGAASIDRSGGVWEPGSAERKWGNSTCGNGRAPSASHQLSHPILTTDWGGQLGVLTHRWRGLKEVKSLAQVPQLVWREKLPQACFTSGTAKQMLEEWWGPWIIEELNSNWASFSALRTAPCWTQACYGRIFWIVKCFSFWMLDAF